MITIVRPLRLADIESLQRIDQAAHGECWSHRTFVEQIEGDDRVHIVVEHNTGIAAHGALWFDREQARITNVAVETAQLRKGFGALVVRHLCEHARAHPQATALTLEVAANNRPAQALYREFGFMPVGIERAFYGSGQDALVMMVRDLCDPTWVRRLADAAPVIEESTKGAVA